MDNDDMLSDFYVEVEELFSDVEDSLFTIENADNYEQSFNSVFRAFHSIKGAAGMFGFERLQQHMHFVEDLLEKRKSATSISPAMVDYLLCSIDIAKKILNNEDVTFDYYDPDTSTSTSTVLSTEKKETIKKEVEVRKENEKFDGYVFIIDDDPDIIEVIELILVGINFKVKTFLDAKSCVKSLATEAPDLIITDLNMPGMNGVELVNIVSKMKPHLPILVVSGFITKEVCLETMALGVSGIIEKPFNHDSFIKMIQLNVKKYKNVRLLNKSIDLIVYQYEDFDKFLFDSGGEAKRNAFRSELKNILMQKKQIFEGLN
jgi:FixJ family two-component response regulator/HPt (histidine-containing phosphotransfer) domain-containing protein